ncbi:MAG TPA: hypothetical protein DIT04_06735 [Dysgonomonas sp.]|nr:hypothetical protein [Dysgonomonas sp.]
MGITRKTINILYGVIGILIFLQALERLWGEGYIDGKMHALYLFMVGPYVGFSKLLAAFFLTIGETLEYFQKKYSVLISTMSCICAYICLFFTFRDMYIWSPLTDFILFGIILTIIYIPVFRGKISLYRKSK